MSKKNIVIFICILVCGFMIGRCTSNKTTIKYIRGETIRDSIMLPFVVTETVPGEPQWLTKRDTMWRDSIVYISETIDTMAILADWIKKRDYQNVLFDIDTIGKLTISASVQYNKLQSLKYEYVPIQKHVITTRKPRFEPFLMGGIQTGWIPSFQGGVFYKSFGIAYDISIDTYLDNGNRKTNITHGVKFGYKF